MCGSLRQKEVKLSQKDEWVAYPTQLQVCTEIAGTVVLLPRWATCPGGQLEPPFVMPGLCNTLPQARKCVWAWCGHNLRLGTVVFLVVDSEALHRGILLFTLASSSYY